MLRSIISLLFLWLVCCFALKPCQEIVKSDLVIEGIVNVIYLMNYTCDACYYEAEQLPSLQLDMMSRGIIINPIIGVNSNPEKVSNHVPGLSVDTTKIWTSLGQHNSDIFIIDNCNRLVYNVIMPWSQYKYPFVKAAILSAYYSNPCGQCPSTIKDEKNNYYTSGTSIVEYPAIKIKPTLEKVLITDDTILPMRIIVQQKHKHHGDPKIYNHVELLAGDSNYHFHPEDENDYFFNIEQSKDNEEISIDGDNVLMNHRIDEHHEIYYNVQNEEDDKEISEQNVSHDLGDKQRLSSHYFNILLWLPQV